MTDPLAPRQAEHRGTAKSPPAHSSRSAIGVDLGGSSVKAVLIVASGEIALRKNIEFDPQQPMDWAGTIREVVQSLRAECSDPACSIGLSAPGLAAPDQRSIAYMPGRLQGLQGLDWTTFLQAPALVPVLNDAHAALLGEAWLGAAVGFDNAFMLTLGTGVGGAALVDGRLLRGQIGRAGHLGHICLDLHGPVGITGLPGSLESMIGNCSILERSNGRFRSTHELLAAQASGDAHACGVWLRSVQALAAAISSLINVLDPAAVIIGGGIARAGPLLFEPLAEYLDPIEWHPGGQRVAVLPAKLGEFAGAIGAARQGLDHFAARPSV